MRIPVGDKFVFEIVLNNQWEVFFTPKHHSIVMLLGLDLIFDDHPDATDTLTGKQAHLKIYSIRLAFIGLELGLNLFHDCEGINEK